MAKIEFSVKFDNKEWKPISISTETSDKNAYRIYRLIIPKKSDFVVDEDQIRAETIEQER